MINPRPRGRKIKKLTIKQAQDMSHIEDARFPKETPGRRECVEFAEKWGWLIIPIHGDEYLKGYPDSIWHHKHHGIRHVEFKRYGPAGKLRVTQIDMFQKLTNHGTGIWILRSSTDYNLLFKPPNWQEWLWKEV